MRRLTQMELIQSGYQILNAKITDADLSMADQGVLIMRLSLVGNGWNVDYGGYVLGVGSLGASEFTGMPKGTEQIMRVMDTVGVASFKELVGSYARIAVSPNDNGRINIIGNIITDKWFDIADFFTEEPTEPEVPPTAEPEVKETVERDSSAEPTESKPTKTKKKAE
jgi:hypothetical protein